MPAFHPGNAPEPVAREPLTKLPFEPVTRSHILHCSYDFWHPRYRSSAIKSRIIPLSPAFITYLREDGIVLPPDTDAPTFPPPTTYTNNSTGDGWDEDPDPDPSLQFAEIHQKIKDTIAELGGVVTPKLNWSSPKDATWINVTKNTMECATPNDIYLLLKSSDFITHDLEHAFDDCLASSTPTPINYVLILRPFFKLNPSLEFRCFVRQRTLLGISSRDLNHFPFLFPLQEKLLTTITEYFNNTLKNTFPDPNFAFDIYLPSPYTKVRLIDINPWAPRTDPLLFSWLELLTFPLPKPLLGIPDSSPTISFPQMSSDESEEEGGGVEEVEWKPELRLVRENDPEARNFSTPQYSAHKLPRDVVDASLAGEDGMKEFAEQWKRMMDGEAGMQGRGEESSDEDEDEHVVEKEEVIHEGDALGEARSEVPVANVASEGRQET